MIKSVCRDSFKSVFLDQDRMDRTEFDLNNVSLPLIKPISLPDDYDKGKIEEKKEDEEAL